MSSDAFSFADHDHLQDTNLASNIRMIAISGNVNESSLHLVLHVRLHVLVTLLSAMTTRNWPLTHDVGDTS